MSIDELQDRRTWIITGALLLGATCFAWSRWDRTPQIGADDEVFKTVDALFTAISTRDLKRLDDCGKRLAAHRSAGRLPEKAARRLDGILVQARAGNWKPAAEDLYTLMLSQRRAG